MAAIRVCSIDGCGKRHFGRGFCNAHYTRWRMHGDPLAGGPPLASPGEPLGWLHRMLAAPRTDECVSWPYARHQNGYGAVKENGVQHLVHRWVCTHEYGPPPSDDHHAAHSCGNGHLGCVNPDHLRWATASENMADTIAHGTSRLGKPGQSRKLTPGEVLTIRALAGQASHREIGRRFGVCAASVGHIQRRQTWAWLN